MLFSSWLRNWKGSLERRHEQRKTRRARPAARRLAPRLYLEALEDRLVPASLDYSTLLNGAVYATAVDSQGDMYVTGYAGSGFSATPGAFNTNGSGAFVAKLSPTGALIYATYLGSGGGQLGFAAGTGIAVDAAGDAYVIGEQPNVPTTANAIASSGGTSGGNADVVAEVNPTGSGLLYATYLPGTVNNPYYTWGCAGAIALDASGNIYVAGQAGSGLPVTASAFQTTYTGGGIVTGPYTAFFMKIDPALSGTASVLYASYLGGSGGAEGDQATGIAVDSAGNAYLEGYTDSANFPTTSGAFQRTNSGGDVFVAKFNPALSGAASLVYSTLLGAGGGVLNQDDGVVPQIDGGIAVDSQGNAYVTSATTSSNFPTTPGAYQLMATSAPGTTGCMGLRQTAFWSPMSS